MKLPYMLIATLGLAACGSSGSGLADANNLQIDAPGITDANIVEPPPATASLYFDVAGQFSEGQSLGYVTSAGVIVQGGGAAGSGSAYATTVSKLLANMPDTTSLFGGQRAMPASNANGYWVAFENGTGLTVAQSTNGTDFDEGVIAYDTYFQSKQSVYNPTTDRFYVFGNRQNESSTPALVLETTSPAYTTLQDSLLGATPTSQPYTGFYVEALQSLVAYSPYEGAYIMGPSGTWGSYLEFVPPVGYNSPERITYFPANNVYVATVYSDTTGEARLAQSANLKDWTLVNTESGEWSTPLYLPDTGELVASWQDENYSACQGNGKLRATSDLETWRDLAVSDYTDSTTKMFVEGDYGAGGIGSLYWIPKLVEGSSDGLLLINLRGC